MEDTVTRIDPDLPLCWESEDTLRLGFERARARLHRPSAATQQLLELLRAGVPTHSLFRTAKRLGASADETRALLASLAPALMTHGSERVHRRGGPLRVRVCVGERDLDTLGRELARAGLDVRDERSIGDDELDLVVIVERYLEPLERASRWLATGVPHLLFRYTDRGLRVGPLVGVGGSPCHSCLVLAELEDDPALPSLASQLIGRRPQSETVQTTLFGASIALCFIGLWTAGVEEASTVQLRIPVSQGAITGPPRLVQVSPHPSCACSGWQRQVTAQAPTPRTAQATRTAPASQPSQPHRTTQPVQTPRTSQAGTVSPASARNREGTLRVRAPAALPDSRNSSSARVNAT